MDKRKLKRIVICGSIGAANEILRIEEELLNRGFLVDVPHSVKDKVLRYRVHGTDSEKVDDKIRYDLIRKHFNKIKTADAVLVVNVEKKGVQGYIGGNTFLEMGFAHVLGKKLYCLYPPPDLPYTAEILAMQPIVLNGDVSKIDKSSS